MRNVVVLTVLHSDKHFGGWRKGACWLCNGGSLEVSPLHLVVPWWVGICRPRGMGL